MTLLAKIKKLWVGKEPQPTAFEKELMERVNMLELANKRLEARLKTVEKDLGCRTTYTNGDLKKLIDWHEQHLSYAIYFERTVNNPEFIKLPIELPIIQK